MRELSPIWFFPLFVATFVAFFRYITLSIAREGGWADLAAQYERQRPYEGPWWSLQTAQIGSWTSYGSALSFGADAECVYVRPAWLYRTGHADLALPWTEITFEPGRLRFSRAVTLRCARVPE